MIITDHINFFPEHPLRGKNFPTGPRFLDMHETYDHALIAQADRIGAEKGIRVVHGVYMGVQGPTYETPAENQMLKMMKIEKLVVPAKSSLELKSGGDHVMLMGLKKELKAGVQ